MKNPFNLKRDDALKRLPALGPMKNPYGLPKGSIAFEDAAPYKGASGSAKVTTKTTPYTKQGNPYLKLNALQQQITNVKGLYNTLGIDPEEATDTRGSIEKLLNLKEDNSGWGNIMELLSRPQQAIAGALNSGDEGMLKGALAGLTGKKRQSGLELAQDLLGIKPEGTFAKWVTELGIDTLTDPLMMIPGEALIKGTSKVLKAPFKLTGSALRTFPAGERLMEGLHNIWGQSWRSIKNKLNISTNEAYKTFKDANNAKNNQVWGMISDITKSANTLQDGISQSAKKLFLKDDNATLRVKKILTGKVSPTRQELQEGLKSHLMQDMEARTQVSGFNVLERLIQSEKDGILIPNAGYFGKEGETLETALKKELKIESSAALQEFSKTNPELFQEALENISKNNKVPKSAVTSSLRDVLNMQKNVEIEARNMFFDKTKLPESSLLRLSSNGGEGLWLGLHPEAKEFIGPKIEWLRKNRKKINSQVDMIEKLKNIGIDGELTLNLNNPLERKLLFSLQRSSKIPLEMDTIGKNGEIIRLPNMNERVFTNFLRNSEDGRNFQRFLQEEYGTPELKAKVRAVDDFTSDIMHYDVKIKESLKRYFVNNEQVNKGKIPVGELNNKYVKSKVNEIIKKGDVPQKFLKDKFVVASKNNFEKQQLAIQQYNNKLKEIKSYKQELKNLEKEKKALLKEQKLQLTQKEAVKKPIIQKVNVKENASTQYWVNRSKEVRKGKKYKKIQDDLFNKMRAVKDKEINEVIKDYQAERAKSMGYALEGKTSFKKEISISKTKKIIINDDSYSTNRTNAISSYGKEEGVRPVNILKQFNNSVMRRISGGIEDISPSLQKVLMRKGLYKKLKKEFEAFLNAETNFNKMLENVALTKDAKGIAALKKEGKLTNVQVAKEAEKTLVKSTNFNKGIKEIDKKIAKIKPLVQGIPGKKPSVGYLNSLKDQYRKNLSRMFRKEELIPEIRSRQKTLTDFFKETFKGSAPNDNVLAMFKDKNFVSMFKQSIGNNFRQNDVNKLLDFLSDKKISQGRINRTNAKLKMDNFDDTLKRLQIGIHERINFMTEKDAQISKILDQMDVESKDYMISTNGLESKTLQTVQRKLANEQNYYNLLHNYYELPKSRGLRDLQKDSAAIRAAVRKADFEYNNLLSNLQAINYSSNEILKVAGEGDLLPMFEKFMAPGYMRHILTPESRVWKQIEALAEMEGVTKDKALVNVIKSFEKTSHSGAMNIQKQWLGTAVDINRGLQDSRKLEIAKSLENGVQETSPYLKKLIKNQNTKLFREDPIYAMVNKLEITPNDLMLNSSINTAIKDGIITQLPEEIKQQTMDALQKALANKELERVDNQKFLINYLNKTLSRSKEFNEFRIVDTAVIDNVRKLWKKIIASGMDSKFIDEQLKLLNPFAGELISNISIIHQGFYSKMKAYLNLVDGHNSFEPIFKIGRKLMSAWKQTALFSIGFHTRNFVSNMMNSWVSGVSTVDTLTHIKQTLPLAQKFSTVLPKEMMNGAINYFKKHNGILRDPALVEEAVRAHLKSKGLSKVYEKYVEYSSKGLTGTTRFTNDYYDIIEKLFKASKGIDEKTIRGSQYVKALKKFSTTNLMATKVADDAFRMAMYEFGKTTKGKALLKKDRIFDINGKTDPVRFANRVFFDYTDTSEFENKVLKNIFPFYTWTRKNIELQMLNMRNHPKRYMWVNKFLTSMQDAEMQTPDDITKYERDNLLLPIPDIISNDPNTMTFLKVNWPIMDIPRFLDGKEILGRINPFLQYPLESLTGVNFFTGKLQNESITGNVLHQFFWDKEGLKSLLSSDAKSDRQHLGLAGQRLANVLDPLRSIFGLKGGANNLEDILPSVVNSSNKIQNRNQALSWRLYLYRTYLNRMRNNGKYIPAYNWYGENPRVSKPRVKFF